MIDSPRAASQIMTMGDLLFTWERDRPDTEALVFPDERVTYRELAERSRYMARGLRALGVAHGDHVSTLLPVGVDQVALFYGTALLGAVLVPMNSRFKSEEIRHVVENSDSKIVVTCATLGESIDVPQLFDEAFPGLASQDGDTLTVDAAPHLKHLVQLGGDKRVGFLGEKEFDQAAEEITNETIDRLHARVALRDLALIVYTSGTTSLPKGAMISHEALVRWGYTAREKWFSLVPSDRVWTALPFFHVGGLCAAVASLATGCTLIHTGFFDPAFAVKQLVEEECTVGLPMVETLWLATLNEYEKSPVDLRRLRLIMTTGVPERLHAMQAKLPEIPIITLYGSTETTAILSVTIPEDPPEIRLTTHGIPVPGIETRVIDAAGQEVSPGEVGELLHRGWARFEGYYNAPDVTAAVVDGDGWFHSGDLATQDAAGRLTFLGRSKDMLKVGGENVATVEIEDYLLRHPAVEIVAVIGVRDDYYTEVPAAYVEMKPGQQITEDELIDFCRGRIASFKVPRYVRFIEAPWPMSGTKIKKSVLKESLTKELDERSIREAPRTSSRNFAKYEGAGT